MRKFLLSAAALFLMAGLVIAAEATITKFDKEKKEITVKEGDAEKTYKITDKTKFTTTDKKGENSKEATYEAFEKGTAKLPKDGLKVDLKTEKGEVTEITWKAGGKKKDK